MGGVPLSAGGLRELKVRITSLNGTIDELQYLKRCVYTPSPWNFHFAQESPMSARPPVLGWAQTARGRALELLKKGKNQGDSG